MNITKATFLNTLACPTFGWREAHSPFKPIPKKDEVRIREGKEIGERARNCFSEGILVDTLNFELAIESTKNLLSNPATKVIFEAAFQFGPFVTRADILVRTSPSSWKLIEVKSSIHKEDQIEDEHLLDASFTAFVIKGAGLTLSDIELMRISKSWRKGMPDLELFKSLSVKDSMNEALLLIEKNAPLVSKSILSEKSPPPKICTSCKDCEYFKVDCVGKDIKHPLFEIPRIDKKKLNALYEDGIHSILDLPDEFSLTANQERVVTAIRTNRPVINKKKLTEILSKAIFPCYYLDFETVKSALPFWENVAPHEQCETQFSLHICDSPGNVISHHEYLSPHQKDSRKEFAEKLIQSLGEKGSIVVYSNFEKTTLNRLGVLFPEHSEQLQKLVSRLFDLEEVFKDAYCHPDFNGRTSIKKVLPVLVPEMTYETLEVGDGETAIAAFIEMALGFSKPNETESIRKALLIYCHQDTLAMVKLHQVLSKELGS